MVIEVPVPVENTPLAPSPPVVIEHPVKLIVLADVAKTAAFSP
jgi:hypothetical protein